MYVREEVGYRDAFVLKKTRKLMNYLPGRSDGDWEGLRRLPVHDKILLESVQEVWQVNFAMIVMFVTQALVYVLSGI